MCIRFRWSQSSNLQTPTGFRARHTTRAASWANAQLVLVDNGNASVVNNVQRLPKGVSTPPWRVYSGEQLPPSTGVPPLLKANRDGLLGECNTPKNNLPASTVSDRSWLAAVRGNSFSFRQLRLRTPLAAASSSARSKPRLGGRLALPMWAWTNGEEPRGGRADSGPNVAIIFRLSAARVRVSVMSERAGGVSYVQANSGTLTSQTSVAVPRVLSPWLSPPRLPGGLRVSSSVSVGRCDIRGKDFKIVHRPGQCYGGMK